MVTQKLYAIDENTVTRPFKHAHNNKKETNNSESSVVRVCVCICIVYTHTQSEHYERIRWSGKKIEEIIPLMDIFIASIICTEMEFRLCVPHIYPFSLS